MLDEDTASERAAENKQKYTEAQAAARDARGGKKGGAGVRIDASGKAQPLADYDATPSGTQKNKVGVQAVPKPEADFADDGFPKSESFPLNLAGRAAYEAAKRDFKAKKTPTPQKAALVNLINKKSGTSTEAGQDK